MDVRGFLQDVVAHIEDCGNPEGIIHLDVPHMGIVHTRFPKSKKNCTVFEPVISLVLQGQKEAFYGDRQVNYGAGDLLIVGQTMPVLSALIDVRPDCPFVAVAVGIDMQVLRSLYGDIDRSDWDGDMSRGLETGVANEDVIDAMARLFKMNGDPLETQALGASALREVYFRVLRSRHAGALRQMLNLDSKASRIARSIAHIRKEYRRAIKASELAAIAGMSASVFYENFKQVTASSPLQYQKELRLLEAQQILQHARAPVSEVAQQVGYESPAQFSREFSRKFGSPPKTFVGAELN